MFIRSLFKDVDVISIHGRQLGKQSSHQYFLFLFWRRNEHGVMKKHHGMARPQVADRGTACDMEGSCEYIE